MERKWTIGNIVYVVNALVLVLSFLLMGVKASHADELSKVTVAEAHTYSAQDKRRLAQADPVDQQLARYSRKIPEIGILRIYGQQGEIFTRKLGQLLGTGAANMDYAHDESQQEDVVQLQLARISNMVKQDMPSATLFKVGKGSAFKHRYLCVITLNTGPYRFDPDYATFFMSSSIANNHGKAPFINNADFLRFTADHEAFHCLNAYFNGASFKKTTSDITSHYDHYLNEAKADAFASLMFKLSDKSRTEFLDRFATMRTQALASMDTMHVTSNVIRKASHNCLDIAMLEPEEVVNFAEKLVKKEAPSRAQYNQYLANMLAAIERLGGNSDSLRMKFANESLPTYNDLQVAAMVKQVENGQRRIQGQAPLVTASKQVNGF